MSEKKSITIDSNSLMGGSGGGASKRKTSRRAGSDNERKIRPSSIVQPSTLKKTLLERIKQHQRTRERSSHSNTGSGAGVGAGSPSDTTSVSGTHTTGDTTNDNFNQSIDFLRKLAMKRRQQQQVTQKRPNTSLSSSSSSMVGGGLPEAKTPEAQMLNKVAETLHNGEILTNTGLLGLPVVPTVITSQPYATTSTPTPTVTASPMISLGAMPMSTPTTIHTPTLMSMTTMPSIEQNISMSVPPPSAPIPEQPKLNQLAEMYNNTVSAVTDVVSETNDTTETKADPPLHIPTKLEDYLPSIFIKEEPPHGCLKNGKKPTFREWATKMLGGKPDSPVKDEGGVTSGGNSEISGAITSGSGLVGNAVNDVNDAQIAGMRVKIRKTHKKRFRIGKHDDVVGVLLKNKQTQRHIQSQHLTLKQKTIGEIRKYLYEHHLLKIGSNAPPDVLRRMYEDAILTGDVKNTNDGVMLHNFMSGGGHE